MSIIYKRILDFSPGGLTARDIVPVGDTGGWRDETRHRNGQNPKPRRKPFWRCDRAKEQSTATIAHLSARALRIQPACPAWGFAGSVAVRPELRSSDGVHALLGFRFFINDYIPPKRLYLLHTLDCGNFLQSDCCMKRHRFHLPTLDEYFRFLPCSSVKLQF
jgi:hypothetical protein